MICDSLSCDSFGDACKEISIKSSVNLQFLQISAMYLEPVYTEFILQVVNICRYS
jgi:hypothetical protein